MQSSFGKRLELIEEAVRTPKLRMSEQEEVIRESVERTLRVSNIIVANVPENPQISDVDIANDILECIDPSAVVSPEHIMRIGKPAGNKPRLLKLKFRNPETARMVLRKKAVLKSSRYSNVSIRDDKTPKQMSYLKQLQGELHRKNNDGQKFTIKYIHGIPQITEIPQAPQISTVIDSSLTNLN